MNDTEKEKPAAEVKLAPGTFLPFITMPNGTIIEGRPGSVAFRNSWLIHPDEVLGIIKDGDAFIIGTTHGNYRLTKAETQRLELVK
jgi:hypothetical protein